MILLCRVQIEKVLKACIDTTTRGVVKTIIGAVCTICKDVIPTRESAF